MLYYFTVIMNDHTLSSFALISEQNFNKTFIIFEPVMTFVRTCL